MKRNIKQPLVGVGVFVFNSQGKFFLGKRKGSHGEGEWSLPGGHLEYFEDMYSCVIRELKEETGIDNIINLKKIGFTENFYPELGKHYITLFFTCESDQKPKLMEPHKCEGWKYFKPIRVPKNIFCGTRTMLDEIIIPKKEEESRLIYRSESSKCKYHECSCGGNCSDE